MPLEYTIFAEEGVILERLTGHVMGAELQPFLERLWADEAYNRDFKVIVDVIDADLQVTRQEVAALSEFLFTASDAGGGWLAFIANKPTEMALSYLLRSQPAMSFKYHIGVYSTWEAVFEFMDISPGLAERILKAR